MPVCVEERRVRARRGRREEEEEEEEEGGRENARQGRERGGGEGEREEEEEEGEIEGICARAQSAGPRVGHRRGRKTSATTRPVECEGASLVAG